MPLNAAPKTPLRWMALPIGVLLLALFLAVPTRAHAEDPKGEKPAKKDKDPDAKDSDAKDADGKDADLKGADAKNDVVPKGDAKDETPPKRAPLLPTILANPKKFAAIVEAARQYFDLDEEHWRGRKAFLGELEAEAAKGHWFLKDMPALRWVIAQGRSFRPPLTDRKWQRSQGITEGKSLGGTLNYIKSNDLTITYSVPRKYPKPKDFGSKFPRIDPLPLLLTMHDRRDNADKHPGKALMKRRYGNKKIWDAIYKQWLVLAPIAPAASFVNKDGPRAGQPKARVFQDPFSVFWKHYHVDFDRVILDGSEDAFTMAGSMPIFFAGVVFRGTWKLGDEQKALVKNFASLPVYVVSNPDLAKALEEAGHPNVTKGIANKSLLDWMTKQRRVAPKTFEWNPSRPDQALPFWVNLDGANWSAATRGLKVSVVDTKDEPNTINIEASNIATFTLFLNDDIVDLDRKVRVVVNGHVEHDEVLKVQDPRIEKLGRDFDFLFNRDPLVIRKSMYFGWLTPSRIVRIVVRKAEPKKKIEAAPMKDDGPRASPEEEVKAERLMTKARELIKKGLTDKALKLVKRVCGMPTNKYTQQAHKLAGELSK